MMSDTICPLCSKKVLDSEQNVDCKGPCLRWFHLECLGMSKNEYQKYASNCRGTWKCMRTDCIPAVQQPTNILSHKISQLIDIVGDLRTKVDSLLEVPNKLISLEEKVLAIESRLDRVESLVQNIEDKDTTEVIEPELMNAEKKDQAFYIMINNMPEINPSLSKVRIREDISQCQKLLDHFIPESKDTVFSCFRVGKRTEGRSRPLKLIFSNSEIAKLFLSKFRKDDLLNIDTALSNISISRDMNDMEQNHLNTLEIELETLTNQGQVGKKSRRGVFRSLLCCFSGSGSSKASKGSGGSEGRCSPQLSPGSPRYLLPTIRHQDMHKKCMVIDLDETLVHSSFKPINNADFVVPVEIDGTVHQVYVLKRPYVDEFLQRMGELYECVLFTASLAKYADPVADLLDRWGVFRARLFRESCVFHRGNYVKDLNKLGRDLQKVIIVDNSPASYIFHPDNAVPVASWFDDMTDTEMLDLIPFFEKLSKVDNVYAVLCNSNHPYNCVGQAANAHPGMGS